MLKGSGGMLIGLGAPLACWLVLSDAAPARDDPLIRIQQWSQAPATTSTRDLMHSLQDGPLAGALPVTFAEGLS